MQTASFVFLFIGLGDIIWGFWGETTDKNPSPTIASRFEAGILFLVVSFLAYLIARRRSGQFGPR